MYKALIVEDNLDIAKDFNNILATYIPDVEVLETVNSYEEAVKRCNEGGFDILFLDIELGEKTGFDVLKDIENRDFNLIITTSHAHYAIEAIKFSALDFLLKPVDVDELKMALSRIGKYSFKKNDFELQLNNLFSHISDNSAKRKKVLLRSKDAIEVVYLDTVVRCEADVNYTVFYMTDGTKKLVSKTLKDFEGMLAGSGFFRPHKSHLINLEHFKSFEKKDGGYIKMVDNSIVSITQRKKDLLFSLLENF